MSTHQDMHVTQCVAGLLDCDPNEPRPRSRERAGQSREERGRRGGGRKGVGGGTRGGRGDEGWEGRGGRGGRDFPGCFVQNPEVFVCLIDFWIYQAVIKVYVAPAM